MLDLRQCTPVKKRLGGLVMTNSIVALVINLARSSDRLAFQQQQLERLGIAWQHLVAVDIDDISKADYEKMANGWERKLRKTEVACFLSHQKAWKKIIETQCPMLILEDDVLLSKYSTALLQSLIESDVAQSADHITLEVRNRKKLLANENKSLNSLFDLFRLYQDRVGAAAYILYPSGAKKLLEKSETHAIALADAFICSHYGLISYQVVPAAAIQSDQCEFYHIAINKFFPSTIYKSAYDKPKPIGKWVKIRFKLRRIFSQLRMGIRQISVMGKASRSYVQARKEDFLP